MDSCGVPSSSAGGRERGRPSRSAGVPGRVVVFGGRGGHGESVVGPRRPINPQNARSPTRPVSHLSSPERSPMPDPAPTDRLLTLRQVAERLNVSLRYVRGLRQSGAWKGPLRHR